MANGTLSFNSTDDVHWADGVAEDGEGGSVNLAGVAIQVGLIRDSNGTPLTAPIQWYNNVDLANTNGFSGLTIFDPVLDQTGWAGFVIKSSDSSEFQINQFQWYDWGGWTGENVNVVGYRDNQQVTSASFATNNDDYSITFSPDSGFDRVDEIRITYADGAGWGAINNIQIADPAPPRVESVSSSDANKTYAPGDVIHLTVTFDQAVDVSIAGGTPTLQLETGSFDQKAVYTGGSGSTTLTFSYTVQPGDISANLDYVSMAALVLNNGTIRLAGSATNATLTLPTPGTAGSLGANNAIVVDGIAPTLAITSSASTTLKAGESTTITFTFSEAPVGFEYSDITVSGGSLGSLSGGGKIFTAVFTPTQGIDAGPVSITVGAGEYTDAAGNLGIAGNSPTITFDSRVPDKPGRPALAAASDSGTPGDGTARDDTPTFSGGPGSAEGGATIRLYINNGSTLIAQTTVAGDGSWSATSSMPLADNTYSVTARVTDAAGNTSVVSDPFTLTIDTNAPDAPARPDLAPGNDSGVSDSDNITDATAQTIRGAAGSAEAGSWISLYNGSNPTTLGSVEVNADGSWSIDVSLGEGVHTITAKALDAAGNASGASQVLTVTVDRTAPVVPTAPMLAAGSDTGLSGSDLLTANNIPTFTGIAESGVTVTLYDTDGREIGHGLAIDGVWAITSIVTLANGAHTIFATARDAAGNVSTVSNGVTFTIDTIAPTLAITSDVATLVIGETATITFTFSEDPGATFTSADIVVYGGTLGALSGSGLVRTAVFTPVAGVDITTASITVAAGSYIDAAGNPGGAGAPPALTFDTRAPAAPSRPDLDALSDNGSSSSDDITGDTMPTFSGIAEIGATVRLYDGDTEIGSVVATDGTWSITSTTLDGGTHSITARVTDPAGNVGPASLPLIIQVVTDAPTTRANSIVFSADSGASNTDFVTRTAAQTISGTLDRALAVGERVEVSFDGGENWTTASSDTPTTWSLATTLVEGTHTVSVRVANVVDNGGPAYIRDYTLDRVAPSVTITSDVARLKSGETATITFTFSEDPGASFTWDGRAGDVVVSGGTLSALSGTGTTRTATFTPDTGVNNGSASITISAGAYADHAGNNGTAGATPSLHFDTLTPGAPSAPVLAPGSDSGSSDSDNLTNRDTLILTGTAEAGATIRLYDTDGVTEIGNAVATGGAWSITTSPLAAGSHSVIARATDAAGNRSPASAGLSVIIDGAAPMIVRSNPADNATNVAISTDLVLTFSETIRLGTGTVDLHAANGDLIETFNVATSSRISIAGNVLTLDPTDPLSGEAGYYLIVSVGAVADAAGNGFAGVTDPGTINFSTSPATTPNTKGGVDIVLTDPSQLTAGSGTSGVDQVFYGGSGTVVLPGDIENVTLTSGHAGVNANALNNVLTGNAGNNTLQGRAGNDEIFGGSRNDTIDSGGGNDLVLGEAGNDHLVGGTGRDTLAGGAGQDWIDGSEGNDRLLGGSGHDTLSGGTGLDVFVFDAKPSQSTNLDRILDFKTSEDSIWLDSVIFTKMGRGSSEGVMLKADLFVAGTKAKDAKDRIIYDRDTGSLYYDRDGNGSAAQVKFATLSNKAKLTYHDLFVI